MKTALWFCLRLRRLHSAYDLVKTKLSESEAEAEELNQSQSMGTCIVIGWSFPFCFRLSLSPTLPTSWFSLDYKQNVSDGVVSIVGRNGNVLILLTPIPVALTTPLTTPSPNPSLLKTSLKKAEDDYNDIVCGQCTLLILYFHCFQNSKLTVKGGWVDDKVRCLY